MIQSELQWCIAAQACLPDVWIISKRDSFSGAALRGNMRMSKSRAILYIPLYPDAAAMEMVHDCDQTLSHLLPPSSGPSRIHGDCGERGAKGCWKARVTGRSVG